MILNYGQNVHKQDEQNNSIPLPNREIRTAALLLGVTRFAMPQTSTHSSCSLAQQPAVDTAHAFPKTHRYLPQVTLPSEVGLAGSCCCWGVAGPPLRRRLAPLLGRPRLRRCRLVGGEPEKNGMVEPWQVFLGGQSTGLHTRG